MATGGDFDGRCDAVGASDDFSGTDAPGSDSSGEERATSGTDDSLVLNINASILQIGGGNSLNFRSVDDQVPSENPSKVKSGDEGGALLRELCKPRGPSGDSSTIKSENNGQPVLREHWKPLGLLSVGRSRLGFPCDNDHLVQLLVDL